MQMKATMRHGLEGPNPEHGGQRPAKPRSSGDSFFAGGNAERHGDPEDGWAVAPQTTNLRRDPAVTRADDVYPKELKTCPHENPSTGVYGGLVRDCQNLGAAETSLVSGRNEPASPARVPGRLERVPLREARLVLTVGRSGKDETAEPGTDQCREVGRGVPTGGARRVRRAAKRLDVTTMADAWRVACVHACGMQCTWSEPLGKMGLWATDPWRAIGGSV